MFCRECGKKVEDGNKFCTYCGEKVLPIGCIEKTVEDIKTVGETKETLPRNVDTIANTNTNTNTNSNSNADTNIDSAKKDKSSFWYNLLGFIMPIAGIIAYLLNKDTYAKKSKSILKWSLAGCITKFVLSICLLVFYIVVIGFCVFGTPASKYNRYYKNNYNKNYNYNYDYNYNFDKEFEKMFDIFGY